MMRGSETTLWTAASLGSLAVHGALAAAIALAPVAAERERPETAIVIQTAHEAQAGGTDARPTAAPLAPAGDMLAALDAAEAEAATPASPETMAETVDAAEPVTPAGPAEAAGAVDAAVPLSAVEEGEAAASPEDMAAQAAMPVPADAVARAIAESGVPVPGAAAGEVAAVASRPADGVIAPVAPPAAAVGVADVSVAQTSRAAGAVVGQVTGAGEAATPAPSSLPAAPVQARGPLAPASAPPAAVAAVPVESQALTGAAAMAVPPVAPAAPVSPVAPRESATVARPLAPQVLAPRETGAQAYARLLEAIAAERDGSCFMALASGRDEEIGVDGFAAEPARMDRFGRRLDETIETPVDLRRHIVSDAQCAALAFAGELGAEAPLSVELAASEIASGGEMIGLVANVRRRWFYLLVVDNRGRVQEIEGDRLFLVQPGTIGFRVPLTLMSGPVDTVQLLLAISSDEILEMVWLREGYEAGTYFEHLRAEIRENGGDVDFGVASFTVR